MRGLSAAAALGAALIACTPASAVTYSFTLTGEYNASWQLDSSPDPDYVDGDEFIINDVAGVFDGTVNGPPELSFYVIEDRVLCPLPIPACHLVNRQGLQVIDFNSADPINYNIPFSAFGDPFWTGTLDNPTFQVGTYALTAFSGPSATLTISAAVPEPAAWAMMIAGFGLVGAALRRPARRGAIAAS